MDKLFKIGEENVIEEGVELLNKIKIIRGISDEQISEYTGIPLFKLKWILSGKSRITGKMADKLSKLGFNWSKR
jgi:plasmid maintenance system antidote protein VapI